MGSTAFKTWELENAVKLVDPTRDALYNYDKAQLDTVQDAKAWKTDPHHFKYVRISAVALLKMVIHARSGGSIEIMGLMQGTIHDETIVIRDAFRLPVEGTETRVNAQDEATEYMARYPELSRLAGQAEDVVGWYHSHPGYGCWLSGIDVGTQNTWQMLGPFVAIVIDPDRTISAGKVEIGAFRCFPDDYNAPQSGSEGSVDSDGFQSIPTGKIEDFGAHSSKYYSLEISHFKSTLDTKLLESLWNKYWVGTLSSSPLFTNRDYGTKQIADLAKKTHGYQEKVKAQSRGVGSVRGHDKDAQLEQLVKASNRVTAEETVGLMAGEIKSKVFIGENEVRQA
ncbi:COP9 signalosome complex subunit 5 [Viridothelium virens]|uniref:COP9 signalosome complex subunit 5 n=1 Tax=Viridothelium virens TaxID=1048519 RepID=A0A6A6HDP0_VIRVR|nr:COP9 signalosome complex subunit 5 [Viridothelium virens]